MGVIQEVAIIAETGTQVSIIHPKSGPLFFLIL